MQIHVTEEARHLSFAREYLRTHVPALGPARRALLALAAPVILGLMARLMLQPRRRLIERYRIPREVVREAYLENPRHADSVRASLGKVRALCQELGLITPRSQRLWRRLGVAS